MDKDLIISIFELIIIFATFGVALYALKVWKKQLTGTDRYNTLKSFMKAAYLVEEKI